MIKRRHTSQFMLGNVGVGSEHPVSVQSMTTTKTRDTEKTLEQIYEIASNGADIVRVTCNEIEAAESLVKICARSPVPVVADIHFQYKLAYLVGKTHRIENCRYSLFDRDDLRFLQLQISEANLRG